MPPEAPEGSGHQRDTGLVRAMGTGALAANIVNSVVGATIFAVPGALAASLGVYAVLAFVGCALVIGAIAICFAEAGSRVPTSGGAYGFIETAFGPLTGYVAGTVLWFAGALASGGLAAAVADVAINLLPPAYAGLAGVLRVAVIIGVIGSIAAVNVRGVLQGARLINTLTLLKLVPLAVFLVVGATAIEAGNFPLGAFAGDGEAGHAIILALFAYMGMETSLCASGEIARPARTIPRALVLAMVGVTLLYTAVQVVAQGILGPALAQSTVPLADAMARVSPALRLLMLAGAAVSMYGWLSSDILSSPRILFALARDGLMPTILGRVHPRTHVPHVAIVAYATLAVLLALSGTFTQLAVLSALATAPLYIAGCAAAWKLARDRVAMAGDPLNFRWLLPAVLVGIASMVAMVAMASPTEIAGLALLVGISVAAYLLQTRLRSAVARRTTGSGAQQ